MVFHFAPDLAHCHCSLKLLLDIHCLVSASILGGLNWMKKMCRFSMVKGCYLALDVYITNYALFFYNFFITPHCPVIAHVVFLEAESCFINNLSHLTALFIF